jgi:hypothetical protein
VAGADDPYRDLSSIRDQDAPERRCPVAHRRRSSLRKDGPAADDSERDVAMLLSWVDVPLLGQHSEGAD